MTASDAKQGSAGEPIRFERAMAELEATVDALESGGLDLDASLKQYEQGVGLVVRCRTLLEQAERRVALLMGVDGEGVAEVRPLPDVE
jgi:exodeoxyribonuclease VII small subunit